MVRLESFNRNLAAAARGRRGASRRRRRRRSPIAAALGGGNPFGHKDSRAKRRRPHRRRQGDQDVRGLLKASRVIDAVNDRFGTLATGSCCSPA